MMRTIQEFYEQNVRLRPIAERLLLATRILNELLPLTVTESHALDGEIWKYQRQL